MEGAQLRLARRVEQTGAWRRHGAASAVAYLAGEQGVTTAAARQQLATSRALPKLDATDQALRRGELSAQQAAAVAAAAQAAAEAEQRARQAAEREATGGTPENETSDEADAGQPGTGRGGASGGDAGGASAGSASGEDVHAGREDERHETPDARETEQQLLDTAQHESVSRLREHARRTKAAADPDPDETARRIYRNRRLQRWNDDGGGYSLFLRATLAQGARIDAALQPLIDQYVQQARRDNRFEPTEAHAADALMTLIGLGSHNHTHHPNETGGSAGGDGGTGEGAPGAQSETAADGADTSQPVDAPAGGTSGGVCGAPLPRGSPS